MFLPSLEWNTPPKPAWDLTDHVCGTQILRRRCGLLDRDELQFYYFDKQFFCCSSLQMPILLASAGVFLIWCFLGTSPQLDTVVWIILEFLQESHFIFCWSISYVSPHFILLTKFPYFQAEGVKRC